MKKFFTFFLSLLACTAVMAQELLERDGVMYEINQYDAFVRDIKAEGKVEIPETVVYDGREIEVRGIKPEAAYGNEKLTSVKLPSSVFVIMSNAFGKCTGLTDINLENVVIIENGAFINCESLLAANLASAMDVQEYAFMECQSLRDVQLCPNMEWISEGTFLGCKNLHEVALPNQLEEIRDNAFALCQLQEIQLPTTLRVIGESAFLGCALQGVKLPASLCEIGDRAFADNPLKNVRTLSPTPLDISEETFSVYDDATLHILVGTKDAYQAHPVWGRFARIMEDELEDPIMYNDNYFYNIYPNAGFAAFTNREGYTYAMVNFTVPESVTYGGREYPVLGIDKRTFAVGNLESVTLPSQLMYIGAEAFYLSKLKTVILPATLTAIGDYALCGNFMTDVTCLATVPPSCGEYAFDYAWNDDHSAYYYTPTLHVPAGCKAVYQEASGWSKFSKIVEDAEQMAASVPGIVSDRAMDDAATYDLSGRRAGMGAKGIVIRNGRKIIQ